MEPIEFSVKMIPSNDGMQVLTFVVSAPAKRQVQQGLEIACRYFRGRPHAFSAVPEMESAFIEPVDGGFESTERICPLRGRLKEPPGE